MLSRFLSPCNERHPARDQARWHPEEDWMALFPTYILDSGAITRCGREGCAGTRAPRIVQDDDGRLTRTGTGGQA